MAAHRLVLAACSPFLKSLILDLGETASTSCSSEPILLVLPDVKAGVYILFRNIYPPFEISCFLGEGGIDVRGKMRKRKNNAKRKTKSKG
jgi:hypothetical protein